VVGVVDASVSCVTCEKEAAAGGSTCWFSTSDVDGEEAVEGSVDSGACREGAGSTGGTDTSTAPSG
jgi:hypothetical protein